MNDTDGTNVKANLVDEQMEIRMVDLDDSYQPIMYEHLPNEYRIELDEFASELLDRDLGKVIIIGSSFSGKTFLLHQLVGNIDRYLEKTNYKKLNFVRINHDELEIIMSLPHRYIDYISALCNELGCLEKEICFVTEDPAIAAKIFSFTKKARIVLEASQSTFMNILNLEAQGNSKIWTSWGFIDADNINLKKKDLVNLIHESLYDRVKENFKIDLTKKTITLFINYVLKQLPELTENGYIIVPVGVWTVAIRRMCGVLGLSESTDLYHGKNIVLGRVIENIYKNSRMMFESFVPENDDEHTIVLNTPFGMAQLSIQDALQNLVQGDEEEEQPIVENIVFNNIDNVNKKLKEEVIGQDEAIDSVTEGLIVPAAGLHDESKPLRSLIFLGPTGVGKTKLATTLAENISETPMNVVRIDMSEYSQPHEAAKLLGAPPGYAGFEKGGVLTNAVKKNPQSLILLDEIEKAHPKIWDSFLQILDAGRMTDGNGQTVDFTQTIIIMTSNIGAKELKTKSLGFNFVPANEQFEQRQKDSAKIVQNALEEEFRPELLNRIDEVIVFKELSHETARSIVKKEISIISDRMKVNGFELNDLSNDIIDEILIMSDVSKYGAREIQRVILKNISNLIARKIVESKDSLDSTKFSLSLDKNKKITIS